VPPVSDQPLTPLAGWGNYPVEACRLSRPQTLAAVSSLVASGTSSYIPRGLGRAYGDSALNLNQGVISHTALNRFLAFDERTGEIECEAGVSLSEIIDVVLPCGWFLPTTPGTKFVTLGGAIAADVHGKNHHVDGSFGSFVVHLQLLTPSGELLKCSPLEQSELFWATVGGMGLTGCIVSARIRLFRVESAFVEVDYRRTRDLDETLSLFSATNRNYRYSVAWIDCLASAGSLGRCVLMLANDAPRSRLPAALADHALRLPQRRKLAVPFNFPAWALNPASAALLSEVYYRRHPDAQAIVDFDTFFYPLDSIAHWNRGYGRRGFVQYQALFPTETSQSGVRRLLETVARSRQATFLAVIKSTGAASQGLLSFCYPGHTLALDLPNTGQALVKLAKDLDKIVLDHGGRLYLAKDALTSAATFRAMYPALARFRQVKALVDPQRRFVSSQARRLQIVESS
jgi:decaprenylphospho-beta-D-ribofuranose 2-oxidase